jgi:hypothetical protein
MNGNWDNYFSDVTPFSVTLSLTPPPGPFSNPLIGISSPFPTPFPPPANVLFPQPVQAYTFDTGKKLKLPVTYNWNFTLEHQFGGDWLGRVAYAGSRGVHVLGIQELNPATYIPGSTLSTDARRPLKGMASVWQYSPYGQTSYNSLQVTGEKRFGRGVPITVRENYTFSKSIDNLTDADELTMPYYLPGALRFDRGLSNFDHTHRFVASYQWQLPALDGSHAVVRRVFGNWELTGVFTAQSGDAFTVLAGADVSRTGIGLDRAQIVGPALGPGACGSNAPCVDWLNPNSFTLPVAGTFGNVGRGSIRGPALKNWDMGLFKNFPFTERYRLQFRAEFFNIFNWVNFADPISSVASGGFGSITAAADPRIGQVALKLFF